MIGSPDDEPALVVKIELSFLQLPELTSSSRMLFIPITGFPHCSPLAPDGEMLADTTLNRNTLPSWNRNRTPPKLLGAPEPLPAMIEFSIVPGSAPPISIPPWKLVRTIERRTAALPRTTLTPTLVLSWMLAAIT